MAPDDDADDLPRGRPLPPEDRLWRHPSEIGAGGAGREQIVLVERTQVSIGRTLAVAALAALLGAGAALAFVLTTGVLVRERPGTSSHEVRGNGGDAPGADVLSVAEKVLDSVAHLEATGPNGTVNATAVVFRSDGELITTANAVDAADHITLVLPGGQRVGTPDVQVAAKSIAADLALLKVPVDGLKPAGGRQSPVERWTPTVVVDASPVTRGPSISDGVITRELAEGPAPPGGEPMYGLVEASTRATTAPLNPGAVFLDDAGLVMGLVTDRARPGPATTATTRAPTTTRARGPLATGAPSPPGDENVEHLAIPGDYAWNIGAQLSDTGKVVLPWVGLPGGEDLTAEESNREQINGGMRVTLIEANTSAWDELKRDDVIVALENHNVNSYNAFITALRRYQVGSYVKLGVLRKGSYATIVLGVKGKPEN